MTRWSERGTHSGAFQGTPPTGEEVTLTGVDIFKIADGRIVEQWCVPICSASCNNLRIGAERSGAYQGGKR